MDASSLFGILNRLQFCAAGVVELATKTHVEEARQAVRTLQTEKAVVLHTRLPQSLGMLVAAHPEAQKCVVILA